MAKRKSKLEGLAETILPADPADYSEPARQLTPEEIMSTLATVGEGLIDGAGFKPRDIFERDLLEALGPYNAARFKARNVEDPRALCARLLVEWLAGRVNL